MESLHISVGNLDSIRSVCVCVFSIITIMQSHMKENRHYYYSKQYKGPFSSMWSCVLLQLLPAPKPKCEGFTLVYVS